MLLSLIARIRGGLSNNSNNRARVVRWNNSSSSSNNNSYLLPPIIEDVSETSSSSEEEAPLSDDDSTCTFLYDYSISSDPYRDVRARLEELSSLDRARYALHSSDNDKQKKEEQEHENVVPITWFIAYTCFLGYFITILLGHVRDFCAIFFGGRFRKSHAKYPSEHRPHYAPLVKSCEDFFDRRIFRRLQECFHHAIASNPGTTIHVMERVSRNAGKTLELFGRADQACFGVDSYASGEHFVTTYHGYVARECLNLGSYNYLGFADDWHSTICAEQVKAALDKFPVSTGSSLIEYGRTELHRQMEQQVAKFVGKEDAICMNMGYNTNATTIPALVGPGDLIVSDKLNHNSIVNGARASGAAIRTFRHNDMRNLEETLREAILMGMPRTRRPWKKILVIVEGIYSMEGTYGDLKNVVRLCKQYGAYVYVDEAHSIGAMGCTGRGIAEYTGVDPADIDIMMGTFTKSFGGLGGYIAASKEMIAFLRKKCAGSVHHTSFSPVVCQQVLSALKIISGEDGTDIGIQKIQSLRDNSNYFRMRLKEMGLYVLGQYDSPVIPVMLYNISKCGAFFRECYKRGLAVAVIGFPATPVLECRARFCVSASHTRADIDRALQVIDEVADLVAIRYGKRTAAPKND